MISDGCYHIIRRTEEGTNVFFSLEAGLKVFPKTAQAACRDLRRPTWGSKSYSDGWALSLQHEYFLKQSACFVFVCFCYSQGTEVNVSAAELSERQSKSENERWRRVKPLRGRAMIHSYVKSSRGAPTHISGVVLQTYSTSLPNMPQL